MSKTTKIQWCDCTINPAMGCGSRCELWPTVAELVSAMSTALAEEGHLGLSEKRMELRNLLGDMLPSDAYQAREKVAAQAADLAEITEQAGRLKLGEKLARAIAREFRCYAGILHLRHGKDDNKPDKKTNRGYAPKFEQIKKFPGRMAEAARWSDLAGSDRPDMEWLKGLPRLIFISDMADLLSPEIDFDYIEKEVIEGVNSPAGKRHIWLWLTKQPRRMAEFSEWLHNQGIAWPDNLVAMTSVTSDKTLSRVGHLMKVKCRYRGLSVEPLWTPVTLPLDGIDWVITGGESGAGAETFDLDWARHIRAQCEENAVAFFMKQLGTKPVENGAPLKLQDKHGGDWAEWPEDLRIRQMPPGFHRMNQGVNH